METKFTEGPWEISKHCSTMIERNRRSIASSGGYQTNFKDTLAENEANAHLIAAAPDLYEALKPFANYACSPSGECDCHNCRARDVLAKARGE